MIRINVAEAKKIKFGVAVSGIETRDLQGTVRLVYEGVEYGFKTSVVGDKMAVEIPPLDEIIKEELKDGTRLQGRLEVIADDTFIIPWTDNFKVIKPIKVKAVVTEDEDIKPQKAKVEVVVEEEIDIKKEVKKEIEKEVKEEGCGTSKKKKSKFAKAMEK
jgi:hypothetical protein